MTNLVARVVPLLCAMVMAAPPAAGAQSTADLREGTRVRIAEAAAGRLVGTVSAVRGDTLVVRSGNDVRAVPFSSIRVLQVSRGRPPRLASALEGGAIGLVTGSAAGAAGAVLGTLVSGDDCDREGEDLLCFSTGTWALVGVIIGAPFGAASGAVAGFLFPRERWRSIGLPGAPALTVHPGAGGVRVGLAIAVP
jgi:hypothetical protein